MAERDLLFEIGAEELPSAPLNKALAQFEALVKERFESAHIKYADFDIFSTPRRIAVLMHGVAEKQPDSVAEYKGPSKSVGFDAEGNPTPAALGFARSKGLDIGDIEIRTLDGVEYLYGTKQQVGTLTIELLPEILQGLITDLDWKRSQRWGSGDERFARPVRWLVALFGSEVIDVKFGHLSAGRVSQAHRFMPQMEVVINQPSDYVSALKDARVIVSKDERRKLILAGLEDRASVYGRALINADVLEEVINLTEDPSILVGTFDESFLRVPREILESAMSKHQRYFAIESADGLLDNHFLVVSNGDTQFAQQIIEGHERVIRARLADAAFFFDEDKKVSLDDWSEKLTQVVFQEKLGTTAQKVERIEKLATYLCDVTGVSPQEKTDTLRAAHLCKADLVTSAVVEFTEVQGIMGGYYALAQGDNTQVAQAITQHYQPRFSNDAIPETTVGQIIAVADKMDTIAGIFAVGKAPKGTSDPFALRRSAIGIMQIVLQNLDLNLDVLIAQALACYDYVSFNHEKTQEEVKKFFIARLASLLKDSGVSTETLNAVLAVSNSCPRDVSARCAALQEFIDQGSEIQTLFSAYKRAKNLSDPTVGVEVNDALLTDVERQFVSALAAQKDSILSALKRKDYPEALKGYVSLKEPVDAFFDNVMIMADDESIKTNRLALLNVFLEVFSTFADFSELA